MYWFRSPKQSSVCTNTFCDGQASCHRSMTCAMFGLFERATASMQRTSKMTSPSGVISLQADSWSVRKLFPGGNFVPVSCTCGGLSAHARHRRQGDRANRIVHCGSETSFFGMIFVKLPKEMKRKSLEGRLVGDGIFMFVSAMISD